MSPISLFLLVALVAHAAADTTDLRNPVPENAVPPAHPVTPAPASAKRSGPPRRENDAVNPRLFKNIRFLDIGSQFLDANGSVRKDLMPDGLHPNAKGYQVWHDAMQPILAKMLEP